MEYNCFLCNPKNFRVDYFYIGFNKNIILRLFFLNFRTIYNIILLRQYVLSTVVQDIYIYIL